MSALGLGLIGGGSLLSGIGGVLGGASANRAARQARDFADRDLLGGQAALGTRLYGSQYGYVPTWQRLLGQAQQQNNQADAQRYAGLIEQASRPTASSLLGRIGSLTDQIGATQQADLGYFDQESGRLNQLFGDARNRLASESGRLNTLAAGNEGIARSFGVGRDRIIRRDSDQQENNLNQRSRAQLSASGLGNTTAVGNAMRGNSAAIGQQRENALQNSQDSRLSALMGARAGRINTGQQTANAMYGADVTGANAQTARATNRLGLTQAQLANNQALRLMPIQTELGVQQSSIMNPSHPNPTQYYPGVNGTANALTGFANSATSAGGLLETLRALGLGGNNIPYGAPGGAGGVYGPPAFG